MDQPIPENPAIRIRADAPLARLNVTVDAAVEEWVRDMEHRHRVSKASVVEIALLHFRMSHGEQSGEVLKSSGGRLRRR